VHDASGSPVLKMRKSADSSLPERASLGSFCSASSVHAIARTEAQRLGLLACLALSNCKRIFGGPCRGPPAALLSKCEHLQIALSQKRASLESCCSASSAHATARTEAQRMGLLACLAPSNFKRFLASACRAPPAALLRKRKCLQIARSQKELAWKAVAQPHLSMPLLTQRHRDWGCLLVLPH